MAEILVACPHCKGTGEIAYSVVRSGEPTLHSKMDCITCNGKKTVSAATAKAFEDAKEIWCKCGNPSGESSYHGDHSGGVISKHHYTCNDCGKITQIG